MVFMLPVSLPQQKAEPRDGPERFVVTPFEHLYPNMSEIVTVLLTRKNKSSQPFCIECCHLEDLEVKT